MKSEIWAPGAQLMESMRAVGYSLTTALADLVDNSVTAKARRIEIVFSSEPQPVLSILDDGIGMDGDAARHAMQLAGTSSTSERAADDLGRFGLGLKTASLSQCRRLTLLTKTDGRVTGLVWDLDHIVETNQWSLMVLDDEEIARVPEYTNLLALTSGTLVVWEKLDRPLGGSADVSKAFDSQMVEAREHLSLVFHRFISGEPPYARTSIAINYVDLQAADPFLTTSSRTQTSAEESIEVAGQEIVVKAFTLPFLNKMTSVERKRASIAGNLRDSQGFYVYRGGRLVIWGTWFRLMPKNDSGKLTRVRVDIPNSLDYLWSLDIKKSSAVPPAVVRDRLKLLAGSMVLPSQRVHSFRGVKVDESLVRPWNLTIDRDTFRYEINRAHPLLDRISAVLDEKSLRDFESALRVLEITFPVQDLVNRVSSDLALTEVDDKDSLRSVLLGLWRQRNAASPAITSAEFLTSMLSVEPFDELRSDPGLASFLEDNR